MSRGSGVLVLLVLGGLLTGRSAAAEVGPAGADEQTLAQAGLKTDGAALLQIFRQRTPAPADAEAYRALVRQLGDPGFDVREQASAALVKAGAGALPFVRQAIQHPDAEVVHRADKVLKELDKDPGDGIPLAAARLAAVRRPAGAVPVLLAYLPFADEAVAEEIRTTLTDLGARDGRPVPELLAGLTHAEAEVRASAAEVLARSGRAADLSAVKPLLHDPEPIVRLRAARAVAGLRDQDAVPVLINLLVDLPAGEAGRAEDCLRELANGSAVAAELGKDRPSRQLCRDAWDAWWRGLDDSALLDQFRKCTLDDSDRVRIEALVRRLGDDDFPVRERSAAALVRLGITAIPLLQQGRADPDYEIAHRCRVCLQQIEKFNPANSSRLVALRRPAGAARVLLAYLPFAHDEPSREEVQSALNVLGANQSPPDSAFHEGLTGKDPLRRVAAATALAQTEEGRRSPELRRLLRDSDPAVQFGVALTLARQKDRAALGVLIEVLGRLPGEQFWQADDLLGRLGAGVTVTPGATPEARQKYQEAWSAWWRKQGATADLAGLDRAPRALGYTLVVMTNEGRIAELDRDGKPRWTLTELKFPFDAQVLPNGRVLIAEFHGRRVTERNLKNEVLWEKEVRWPISCQRLPNGNTFIASRTHLMEVDRAGRELYAVERPNDVLAARKLRGGEIAVILNNRRFLRMNTAGKELKTFDLGPVQQFIQFDVLPHGGILVPQAAANKVVEFDSDGKVLRELSAPFPFSATRLPDGQTLIACQNNNQVLELDRHGNTVREYRTETGPWRARRR